MRLINMSFILHTHWFEVEEDVPRDPDMILHRPESDMWKSLQQGLGTLQSLTELIIWIDCYDERCCEPLFSVPSLFEIGTGTSPTPKTTFILPAREEQHFDKLKDGISVIKRGEPKFHGDIDSHPYDCVVWKGQWFPLPFHGTIITAHRAPRRFFFPRRTIWR
jgi:hypothetical protein